MTLPNSGDIENVEESVKTPRRQYVRNQHQRESNFLATHANVGIAVK
ncbi:MAG: hypothetical protein KDD66_02630 [Bdellovibrionales bacterium]|nr:hypothetical protein [Bdellovibrionales bacterium]